MKDERVNLFSSKMDKDRVSDHKKGSQNDDFHFQFEVVASQRYRQIIGNLSCKDCHFQVE